MRKLALGSAWIAAAIVAGALARGEDKPADPKLPWNPFETSLVGDWAAWLKVTSGSFGDAKIAVTTRVTGVQASLVAIDTKSRDLATKRGGENPKALSRKEPPTYEVLFDLRPDDVAKRHVDEEKKTVSGREFACTKVTLELKPRSSGKTVTNETLVAWLAKDVKT